jgi:hypothetical protein
MDGYFQRFGSLSVFGAVSLRVKHLGREAAHSPPTQPSVEVKNACMKLRTMHWLANAWFLTSYTGYIKLRRMFVFIITLR